MNECVNDSIDGMYLHHCLYGGVQMRCLLSGAVTVPPDQPHGRANFRGTQRQFSENICSEDDLRSRIFGTFLVKFLACLPLLGFSNI